MTIWNDDLGRLIGLGSNVESAKEIFALGSAEISFLWGPRDCSTVFSQGLNIFWNTASSYTGDCTTDNHSRPAMIHIFKDVGVDYITSLPIILQYTTQQNERNMTQLC